MQLEAKIEPPRPLSSAERGILDRLLSSPFPGREQLQEQLHLALVSAICTCGCHSFILEMDRSATPKAPVRTRIPVEAEGVDQDGVRVHFLLHVVEGYARELEIYREDSAPVRRLPSPDTLEIFRPYEE